MRFFLRGIDQRIGRRVWSFAGFFEQEGARQGIEEFGGFGSQELQRGRQGHRRRMVLLPGARGIAVLNLLLQRR